LNFNPKLKHVHRRRTSLHRVRFRVRVRDRVKVRFRARARVRVRVRVRVTCNNSMGFIFMPSIGVNKAFDLYLQLGVTITTASVYG